MNATYREQADKLLTPEGLIPAAVAVALWTLMSICSYRLLRARPDLPHQRELLWGALWSPLILLVVTVSAFVVAYLGLTRTQYPLSSVIVGKAIFEVGFCAFPLWLQRRLSGAGFSLIWLSARLRGKEPNVEEWLANVLGQGPRGRWWRRAAQAVFALLVGLDGYLLLGFMYPMDIGFARYDAATAVCDSVASLVRAGLRAPEIEKVDAYEPREVYDLVSEQAGDWATVRNSLHQILLGSPSLATASSGPYALFVRLRPGARRRGAEEVLRQAQRLLAAHGERHSWRIAVYVRDGATNVVGIYSPKASARPSPPSPLPSRGAGLPAGDLT